MMNKTPNNQPDWTYQGVKRQLEGMDCNLYVLGILDRKTNHMEYERLTQKQVLDKVKDLKKFNAWGRDIYIKPAPDEEGNNTGLIMIDDLGMGTLNRLEKDGLKPVATVKTSPQNYQAWVRLSVEPIPREIATAAARVLAAKYGGDSAAAQDRQFGRLAGFTNRKPIYAPRQPFITSEKGYCDVAPNAQEILQEAAEKVRKDQEAEARAAQLRQEEEDRNPQPRTGKQSPSECYQQLDQEKRAWLDSQGMRHDRSRIDWMIASDMLKFRYTVEEVAAAILENSEKGGERTNPEAYARTTAEKAAMNLQQQRTSRPKLRPKP
jgi:RepB DNA-primase from phage plasmid